MFDEWLINDWLMIDDDDDEDDDDDDDECWGGAGIKTVGDSISGFIMSFMGLPSGKLT